jgi:two-component system chemotaxis response regulator CheY
MKVLIVDDNGMMRDVMRMFLEHAKHEVLGEAWDGASAVKAFTELRPEVVLLDLVMPGTTGLEVLEKIKAIEPSVKVVIVTAVEQEAMDKKILEQGAVAVLHKPFLSEELEAVMQRLV